MQEAPRSPDANGNARGEAGMDRRQGSRMGDVRIRRKRGHRRGVLRALRAVPNVIRRATPFA